MPKRSREGRVSKWVEKVQPLIAYCDGRGCQPVDEGELYWVQGDRTNLGDLLLEQGVPEDLVDDVAAGLHCNECGETEFTTFTDVGLLTEEEKAYQQRWDEWTKKYAARVQEFGEYLSKYPYLGCAHPLGRELRDTIAGYAAGEIEAASWWRARGPDGKRRFNTEDMLPPPASEAKAEGRFNHYGQAAFYLADSEELALTETLEFEKKEVLAWTQEFRVPRVSQVLDLTSPEWWDEERVPLLALGLMSHLRRAVPLRDSPWKPEYFIPRYIADCAKEAKFDAIRFESARSFGMNLVLFRWDSTAITPVGEPQIRTFVPSEPDF